MFILGNMIEFISKGTEFVSEGDCHEFVLGEIKMVRRYLTEANIVLLKTCQYFRINMAYDT